MSSPRTLYDKIWDDHAVATRPDGTTTLYIDRHVMHEVTTAQAFDGIRRRGLPLARPDQMLAMLDHSVTTGDRGARLADEPVGELQLRTLQKNMAEYTTVKFFDIHDPRQGIVHVVAPEQGFTLPGTTLVCGDSHTSTHGALGALSFGIGTSEVEHVFATQTVIRRRARNMLIELTGTPGPGTSAKDLVLAAIGALGTASGTGCVVEFAGDPIRALSIEGRMTVCNMAIELGARSGLIAPDEKTIEYVRGRPLAPTGANWDAAVAYWRTLASDPGAHVAHGNVVRVDVNGLVPQVTWGTSPQDVAGIDGRVPDPAGIPDANRREAMERALAYMGLEPGTPLAQVPIEHVFIGSCTNSRIEDLRAAAAVARGRKVDKRVRALVVPGSGLVKQQAEAEGLHRIFLDAGFEWRNPGCSRCIAMNADWVPPRERCASTSNRNFEGRQGRDARTHLVSPATAAAAAITGRLADVREFLQ